MSSYQRVDFECDLIIEWTLSVILSLSDFDCNLISEWTLSVILSLSGL